MSTQRSVYRGSWEWHLGCTSPHKRGVSRLACHSFPEPGEPEMPGESAELQGANPGPFPAYFLLLEGSCKSLVPLPNESSLRFASTIIIASIAFMFM